MKQLSEHEKIMQMYRKSPIYKEAKCMQFHPDEQKQAKLFVKMKPDQNLQRNLVKCYMQQSRTPLNLKETIKNEFQPIIQFQEGLPQEKPVQKLKRSEQEKVFKHLYSQQKITYSSQHPRESDKDQPCFVPQGKRCVGIRPRSPPLAKLLLKYNIKSIQ